MCSISSGQLIGWPLSRSTRAAASSALDFDAALAALAAAGGDTRSGVDGGGPLAGGLFFGAGSGEVRFFLAVMVYLRGRQLESASGAPAAPPHQGRRTTSTAPTTPGNCGQNPKDSELCDCRSCVGRCRATRPVGTLQSAPAPALLVPVEGCRNMQYLSQHRHVATAGRSLKEQQLFLQVGGEMEKGEDLTHARPADAAQSSRRRVAAQCSRANQVVDMPGQGHKPCDARNAGRACLCRFRCRHRVVLWRASAPTQRQGASNDGGGIHALSCREEEGALSVMAISPVVPS